MDPISYAQVLQLAWPEIIVTIAALVAMAVDLLALRRMPIRTRFTVASAIASLGCVVAIARILLAPVQANLLDGTLIGSPLTHIVQIALLALTVFTLLISADSDFTTHVGEFVLLILVATVGMMFLVATQDILVIFISLELLSLSLYILAAFNKQSLQSWEAAIKYFLFGGMSAAFLLFGFSLLYGLSNSTSLPHIAAAIQSQSQPAPALNPLLVIAIVTTAIGLGFKVAAAPFHFWAPDVYQGAPAPSASLIASGSKVASFFVLFQIAAIGLAGAAGTATLRHPVRGWAPVIALIAAVSMLLGNFVAITQVSLRRLLAYSAIAHAGYMLLAIAAHTEQSLASLLYYVITYALANIGAFGVIDIVEKQTGSDLITNFQGLSRRAPALSLCLAVFILSLAGIPPLAGFFGKFYLFAAALESTPGSMSMLWLVVLAIALSAVSLYYYLRVLKSAFVTPPATDAAPLKAAASTQVAVVLLALAVLLFGCVPQLLLSPIQQAIRISGL